MVCPLTSYHTHEELQRELRQLADRYPEHARLFQIGTSNRGHPLVGLRLSRDLARLDGSPRASPLRERPRVKLIGNMHGNEPVGRELLTYFARYLLESDGGRDRRAARLLESVDLHILPTMNPDGFARGEEGKCSGGSYHAGRLNEGRMDLNRDFPDFDEWQRLKTRPGYTVENLYEGRQKETRHLMDWILRGHFVLSANFHDGAVLVNYPWDNYHDSGRRTGVFRTPNHDEFYQLATSYSLVHPTMPNTTAACSQWGHFEDGVTNGADWYPVRGGMQDFNYLFAGTMEVTMEISCCKFPHSRRLLREWDYNKESLFNFVEQAQRGVRGEVRDEAGKVVPGARIRVRKVVRRRRQASEQEWRKSAAVSTDDAGQFWRILVPGVYDVQAFKVESEVRTKKAKVIALSNIQRVVVQDEKRHAVVSLVLRTRKSPIDNNNNIDNSGEGGGDNESVVNSSSVDAPDEIGPRADSPTPFPPQPAPGDRVPDEDAAIKPALPARLRSSRARLASIRRVVFQKK